MIIDSTQFVEYVYSGYHLGNLKDELIRFSYNTSVDTQLTDDMVKDIVNGFKSKGMFATVETNDLSFKVTLEFIK